MVGVERSPSQPGTSRGHGACIPTYVTNDLVTSGLPMGRNQFASGLWILFRGLRLRRVSRAVTASSLGALVGTKFLVVPHAQYSCRRRRKASKIRQPNELGQTRPLAAKPAATLPVPT